MLESKKIFAPLAYGVRTLKKKQQPFRRSIELKERPGQT
jgi:hypothetical protein